MVAPLDNSTLRVAIIGSGPSAFYAADHLLKQTQPVVEIEMFERLPTPFGLVRGGVAPDHAKIKSVTKTYDEIANNPRFRYRGNVTFGKDITLADLKTVFHAIIFAVGAQTDRQLGITGENLLGSHAATEFVGWYNGHPDYRDYQFDLNTSAVAVIGNGNVAMDVARILASTPEELAVTDIADYALDALRASKIQDIYVIGRRGPAQAAFTTPEIKEFGQLIDAEPIVSEEDVTLDPVSEASLLTDKTAGRNVAILRGFAKQALQGKSRRVHFLFLESPLELLGETSVEGIKLAKNALIQDETGAQRPRPTGETETLPVGLVFRSIGYQGVALRDVPFDEKRAVIPNQAGRAILLENENPLYGLYVAGWIKRGPSGIIGTNRPDSVETATTLLADWNAGLLHQPTHDLASIDALLQARGVQYIDFHDWKLLDREEQRRGAESSPTRPRVKFTRINEMLEWLAQEKQRIAVAAD